MDYKMFLTQAGIARIAEAISQGAMPLIAHFAIGDGGGAAYEVAQDQTELRNEVWRGPVESIRLRPGTTNVIEVNCRVPPDVGGWWMREHALIDADGVVISVAAVAEAYKPVQSNSADAAAYYRPMIAISNDGDIQVVCDPAEAATVVEVEEMIAAHDADPDAHAELFAGLASGPTGSVEATPNTLALRNGEGTFQVTTPVKGEDAVNKDYADAKATVGEEAPLPDGTASAGTSEFAAREDHQHGTPFRSNVVHPLINDGTPSNTGTKFKDMPAGMYKKTKTLVVPAPAFCNWITGGGANCDGFYFVESGLYELAITMTLQAVQAISTAKYFFGPSFSLYRQLASNGSAGCEEHMAGAGVPQTYNGLTFPIAAGATIGTYHARVTMVAVANQVWTLEINGPGITETTKVTDASLIVRQLAKF